MTTIEELQAALDAAQQGAPEESVERLITVYFQAKDKWMACCEVEAEWRKWYATDQTIDFNGGIPNQHWADAYFDVMNAARRMIQDVMTETGVTSFKTPAGRVHLRKPSVSHNGVKRSAGLTITGAK